MNPDRADLGRRQQQVLASLLAGEVPDGFDQRSARLTTDVLVGKRRWEAAEALPALRELPDWRRRFDTWARTHPRVGCAHDDARAFVADQRGRLPEPLRSTRAVERVYDRRRVLARDRRPGARPWVLGLGGAVWHLGRLHLAITRSRPATRPEPRPAPRRTAAR